MYKIIVKYYPGEQLGNLSQKGKGKLSLFCGNGEWAIPVCTRYSGLVCWFGRATDLVDQIFLVSFLAFWKILGVQYGSSGYRRFLRGS